MIQICGYDGYNGYNAGFLVKVYWLGKVFLGWSVFIVRVLRLRGSVVWVSLLK